MLPRSQTPPAARRYDKHAPVSPLARSLTHSFILPPSLPPLRHSLTLPCTHISLSICPPPAFLGHSAPPTFIHTTPCFVFMRAGWRAVVGGTDGRMISLIQQQRWRRGEVGGAGGAAASWRITSSSAQKTHTHTRNTLTVSFINFPARAQTQTRSHARTHRFQ